MSAFNYIFSLFKKWKYLSNCESSVKSNLLIPKRFFFFKFLPSQYQQTFWQPIKGFSNEMWFQSIYWLSLLFHAVIWRCVVSVKHFAGKTFQNRATACSTARWFYMNDDCTAFVWYMAKTWYQLSQNAVQFEANVIPQLKVYYFQQKLS